MGASKRKLRFAYCDRFLEAQIPEENLVEVIRATPVPPLADIEGEVRRCLKEPIGTEPLARLAAGVEEVLIAVPDHTRPMNLAPVLRPVLEELKNAGLKPRQVKIASAGGTHTPMTDDELSKQWGGDLLREYSFIKHRWGRSEDLVSFGVSKSGIPLEFNKALFEADLVIGLGGVKPHPVAGWSGGAKIILPGLAGQAGTDALHWAAASHPVEQIFGQPDNPVRRKMEEAVGEVGLHFIVNVIENRAGEIAGAAAGHFVQAHRRLVEQARSIPLIDLPLELPDVMIVGSGADRPELWEGMAGLYLANFLLLDGGTLILAAACPKGVAPEHPEVLQWGYRPYEEVLRLVEQGQVKDLTAASHMALAGSILSRKQFRLILVSSGVGASDASSLGLEWAPGLEDALKRVWERHGRDARILTYERI